MIRFLATIGAGVMFWLVGHSSSGELLAFLPLLALIPAAAGAGAAGGLGVGAIAGIAGGAAGSAALGAARRVGGGRPGAIPGLEAQVPQAGPMNGNPTVSGAPATVRAETSLPPFQTPGSPPIQGTGAFKPGAYQDFKDLISKALNGLSSSQKSSALSELDRRTAPAPVARAGGGVPGLAPPQIAVTQSLVDRVRSTRGQYPAVPGLGG